MEAEYDYLRKRVVKNVVYRRMLDAIIHKALAFLDSRKTFLKIAQTPEMVARIDGLTLKDLHIEFKTTYHDYLVDYYSARNFFALLHNVGVLREFDPSTEQDIILNILGQKKHDRRRAVFLINTDKLVELLIPLYCEIHREEYLTSPQKI